jgi:hypothetical protein
MTTNPDDLVIEQPSTRNAVGADVGSRRLLMWAQLDLMAGAEVSTTRRLTAWVALGITFLIALMLLLGY